MDERNGHPADELDAVRAVFSRPGPSPEAVAAGRDRLLAEAAAVPTAPPERPGRRPAAGTRTREDAVASGRWPGRRDPAGSRVRRWAPAGRGLAGVAAAAALALAMTLPSDAPIRLAPDQAGTAPATPGSDRPDARQILLAAASATAGEPAGGAYWRTRVVTGQRILSPDRRYVIARRSTRETWLTRQDGRQDRWAGRYLGAGPATPRDEAAWRAAGSPGTWRYPADVTGLGRVTPEALVEAAPGEPRSGPHRVGWRDADGILTKQLTGWKALGTIPDDPARLRAYLVARIARENGAYVGREMEAELRKTCLEIISRLPVSPELRAAAYRILASLPGMTAEGQVTDPLGRTGQALTYQVVEDGRLSDRRLVIDPASGLPLAEETSSAATLAGGQDTQVGSFVAFEAIGWTDEEPMH
ncbi:CU044_5270 family protein [Nonomuraea muscovyensis]